jgi:hypothetical protein
MSVMVEQKNRLISSSQTIQVQIGDVSCLIICHDATIMRYFRQLYTGFLSDKSADIVVDLDIVEQFKALDLESPVRPVKKLMWGDQVAAICTIGGKISTGERSTIKITVERQRLAPRFGFKIMNMLLPAAYYTVLQEKQQDNLPAMLVHACGIIRQGRLMIFTGPSEMGKTTIARFCGDKHGQVVNDEMLLVTGTGMDGVELMIQGVPVIGGVAQRLNVKAPLECVFMLKQSQKTSIRALDRVEAYRRFLRQVILPRNLIKPDDNTTMLTGIARFSDLMTKAVPFYELEFTLEQEVLWRAVDEIEESLMKGQIA